MRSGSERIRQNQAAADSALSLSNKDYQQMTLTMPGVVDKMLYIKHDPYTGILKRGGCG